MCSKMVENLITLVHKLTSIPAPSGNEDDLAAFIMERLKNAPCNVEKDVMGNIVVTAPRKASQRIAIVSHMDEIFALVRRIDDHGFLHLEPAPGLSLRDIYGRAVLVKTFSGWIPGKICAIPNHLTSEDDDRVVPKQMFVDIGCASRDEVLALGVYLGAPVVFMRDFFVSQQKIFSTALDDRAGIAVLLAMIYEDQLFEHAAVIFSTKEEFLLRGSVTALRTLNPEIIIYVDASLAFDTPDLECTTDVRLGHGPVFSVFSFHGKGAIIGTIQNTRTVQRMLNLSKEKRIPLQIGVFKGIVTECAYAQLEGRGTLVIELGFPTRYMHTGVEVCDVRDLYLLKDFLKMLIINNYINEVTRLC